jgi:hypothetical protein
MKIYGVHNSIVSKYKDCNIFFEFSRLTVASIYTLFNYDLGLSLQHLQSHTMSSYQWHHSLQLVILVQNLKSTRDKFTTSQQCNITLGALIPSIAWLIIFSGHSCFYHSPPKYHNQSFTTINDLEGFKSFHEDLLIYLPTIKRNLIHNALPNMGLHLSYLHYNWELKVVVMVKTTY